MKLEDAINKSIKRYFEGMSPSELRGATQKKGKYNKKYFDKMAEKFGVETYGAERYGETDAD